MSSVPVQFLIHVLPTPYCSLLPVFNPITGCLEVQVNVPFTFDLYVNNSCNPTIANVTDIVVSTPIIGVTDSNFTSSSDGSFAFVTFNWTPQPNQIGPQQLCTVAFARFNIFYLCFFLISFVIIVEWYSLTNIA